MNDIYKYAYCYLLYLGLKIHEIIFLSVDSVLYLISCNLLLIVKFLFLSPKFNIWRSESNSGLNNKVWKCGIMAKRNFTVASIVIKLRDKPRVVCFPYICLSESHKVELEQPRWKLFPSFLLLIKCRLDHSWPQVLIYQPLA